MKRKIFAIILTIFILVGCNNRNTSDKKVEEKAPEPVVEEKFYSPLTGLEIPKTEVDKRIYAIMFDNHPKARPQSGISEADVLYEFLAEGEFTRYMGLYYNHLPNVIGPVRSARPYFINTAISYNGIYIHWGASEKGYEVLKSSGVEELDGIFLERKTFYRNKEVKKWAPHNGYTTDELLREEFANKGFSETSTEKDFFKFSNEDIDTTTMWTDSNPVESYKLNIFPSYNVTFKYNPEKSAFNVYRKDDIVSDERDEQPISPVNVIILFVDSHVVGPKDTLKLDFTGEGTGKYLCDGKIIDITWHRDSETSKTIYKTTSGNDLILKPGQTFIEVVKPNTKTEILPEIVEPVEETQGESANNTPSQE